MKRIWLAAGLLLLLLAGTLAHSVSITRFTDSLKTELSQAAESADAGDWSGAEALTAHARQQWQQREFYLHALLRHGSLDAIRTGFSEAEEYLRHRLPGEYSAAVARLIQSLTLLSEAEQLTWANVL